MSSQNQDARTRTFKILAVVLPGIAGLVVLLFLERIPQDPAYHDFADKRTLLGVPHAMDVLSNLAFVLAGFHGLWVLRKKTDGQSAGAFLDPKEHDAYFYFFLGVALTGLGSGWYHLNPSTDSLFWDRLPMTIAFMSLFAAMIQERMSLRAGKFLLKPLILVGAATIIYWRVTENAGNGDLRFYGLVQFYPMVAIPLMLLLFPPRYTHGHYFWWLFIAYGLAKIVEHFDQAVFSLTGFLSGHSLKHLLAALGTWGLVWMLKRRKGMDN
ncbi:MAG: ceramidase domain-containing protein [Planctomycetota bacterium]|jgi:hypothetical protein